MDPAAGNHQHHAARSGCDGLADGWARRLSNDEPVHASQVGRLDGPFYCTACHAEVVLHKGAERAPHFAHEGPRAASGGEEGVLHRLCKEEIHAALASENPEGHWDIERTLPGRPDRGIAEIRPDISGRVRGVAVAVEVQASVLGVEAIFRRARIYAARRLPVLWLVPLDRPPDDDGIRPRLHERYFHAMYLGRTYYWWPGLAASVLPVHYGNVTRWVPRSEWYRSGAGRMQAGGYEARYLGIKMPICGPRLRISHDFGPRHRASFVPGNERKAVPACDLWFDRLAPWW